MTALDTNILIYACDARFPDKQAAALNLVEGLSDGVLLWQVACEFISASRKLAPFGFTTAQAWERLSELSELLPLRLPSVAVIEHAKRLTSTGTIHVWDALLYAACIDASIGRLYSEDEPGHAIAGLEIINPFAGLQPK